jgi:hypothetical protein
VSLKKLQFGLTYFLGFRNEILLKKEGQQQKPAYMSVCGCSLNLGLPDMKQTPCAQLNLKFRNTARFFFFWPVV